MIVLKFIRFIAWLLMTGSLLTGVVALFSADWALVAASVVGFFVVGFVFSVTHRGIEGVARQRVAGSFEDIAFLVRVQDWNGALRASNRAVAELSSTVRAVGKSSENRGPLAAMLVLQSALLGLTGDFSGAEFAAQRATSLLQGISAPTPMAMELLRYARELQTRGHDQVLCTRVAFALTS